MKEQGQIITEGSFQYFKNLGMDDEVARVLERSWGYQPPVLNTEADIPAYTAYLRAGTNAERDRRDQSTNDSDWLKELQERTGNT